MTRPAVAGLAAVAALAAAVSGAAVWWVVGHSQPSDAVAAPAVELATAPVARGDLVATVQLPGRLGYSGTYTIVGQRAGTVTAAPSPGTVVRRGDRVYTVDQRPIPLLYGTIPVYRALSPGDEGADVRQLEENLVALGVGGQLTVDSDYTGATAAAVRRWQRRLGVEETGTVAPGDAVVAPGELRVSTVDALVGGPARAGERVLSGTGTGHSAYVDVPLAARAYVRGGQQVRVQLPTGRPATGDVASVAADAVPLAGNQGGSAAQSGGQPAPCQGTTCPQAVTAEIRITADLGDVTEGPVSVTFDGETRRGVLSVPIEALTVAPGGRFAVVVRNGAQRRTVEVTTGLFSSGRVEVTGAGLAEGVQVEVPGR
ncbi:peptidoglycan-binding protein [Dactylosporangium sp. NPDC049140]|uniref:peptidoglycan-binding protein n=1 Tax=Dactylosporangium sp. NPDC049140 TaxID=3155647 RepID=UPI0033D85E89